MSEYEGKNSEEIWDARELGASEEHAQVASGIDESTIDAALELHPISIRLQKSLVEDLKHIAKIHGLGYQPLIRQVLTRFVESEKKRILKETRNQLENDESGSDDSSQKAAIG
mgnify:CR=1 FL=1